MEQDLSAVKYVGPASARRLAAHGVTTVEQLAAMSVDELAAIPGIGANTAPLIIASAQEITNSAQEPLEQPQLSGGESEAPAKDDAPLLVDAVDETPEEEVVEVIDSDEPEEQVEAHKAEIQVQENEGDSIEPVDSAVTPMPDLSSKAIKKLKKLAKRAKKKAKKQEKEAKKATRKAEKKAKKKALKESKKEKKKAKKKDKKKD